MLTKSRERRRNGRIAWTEDCWLSDSVERRKFNAIVGRGGTTGFGATTAAEAAGEVLEG
jgi:hypothetical protein